MIAQQVRTRYDLRLIPARFWRHRGSPGSFGCQPKTLKPVRKTQNTNDVWRSPPSAMTEGQIFIHQFHYCSPNQQSYCRTSRDMTSTLEQSQFLQIKLTPLLELIYSGMLPCFLHALGSGPFVSKSFNPHISQRRVSAGRITASIYCLDAE